MAKLSASEVKALAHGLGFAAVGITTADPLATDEERGLRLINEGRMAGLAWFTADRFRRSCRPAERFSWARSIVSLGMPYATASDRGFRSGPHGRVARYAWAADYHKALGDKLLALGDELSSRAGASVRCYVDTGPMAERALATRAGLGWFGKNTNLLTTSQGSWLLLGELLTDLELEPDEGLHKSCGNCAVCLAACPTGALVAPYALDNARCIAYLTIELRGSIPRGLRDKIGDRVFGCDICQEVCPVSRRAQRRVAEPIAARWADLDLVELLRMGEEGYREAFRGSALRRAGRLGLQRNAAVVLGNLRAGEAVPALAERLQDGADVLRAHCAWALGRIGGVDARSTLLRCRRDERDPVVLEEIDLALGAC